jgi:adenylyltransferase/sulfurtransferase
MNIKKEKKWGEDVFPLLSWFKIDKVKNAKVMVVGAGALGNEALKNLALFGVGHIVVVDFDKIEYSNLTRSILFRPEDADKGYYKAEIAAKRLKEINPTIQVEAICGDLAADVGLGVYRRMDVVIGCLDSVWARVLLNHQCFRVNKIWIEGGIGDLEGQVAAYQLDKSCYECSLSEEELADLQNSMPCPWIAEINQEHGRVATTPVSASIIAAIQVQEAMKIIHKEEIDAQEEMTIIPKKEIDAQGEITIIHKEEIDAQEEMKIISKEEIDAFVLIPAKKSVLPRGAGVFTTLVGNMFHYEGAHPNAENFTFSSYYNDCSAHEHWENIVEIPELGAFCTVKDTLRILKEILGVQSVEINLLNNKFVDFLTSRSDNKKFTVMLPVSKISDYIKSSSELEFLSISQGGLLQNEFENIDDEFPYPDLTLKQIGVPYFDILKIETEKGYFYVELSADKQRYKTILEDEQ